MAMGCVYAATNPAMPGLVKIGQAYEPDVRVYHLSRFTAVPAPFELAYTTDLMPAADLAEAIAHDELRAHRFRENREFFRVSVEQAMHTIQVAALLALWKTALPDDREEFLARIGR